MQSLERNQSVDQKQAEKRLKRRARLQRAQKRKETGIIRLFLFFLVGLTCYGLSFLDLLPGSKTLAQAYNQTTAFLHKQFNDISFRAGFQIQDISVSGLINLQEEEVLSVLGFGAGVSSLNYDSRKAWKKLKELKWVKKAKVQLLLPGTLYIEIEEYSPYARIQEFGQHYLINEQSEILKYYKGKGYNSLPLFVGFGAKQNAVALNKVLKLYPKLSKKIVASIRVDDRRWDLLTNKGQRIMMPEHGLKPALQEIVRLDTAYRLLEQDYHLIDLRIAGRLRIQKKARRKDKLSALDYKLFQRNQKRARL